MQGHNRVLLSIYAKADSSPWQVQVTYDEAVAIRDDWQAASEGTIGFKGTLNCADLNKVELTMDREEIRAMEIREVKGL